MKEITAFTIKARGNCDFMVSGSLLIIKWIISDLLFCSRYRSSQRGAYTTFWMGCMKSGATGCVTSIQHALWKSRTWLHARVAWTSFSTPPNDFSQARSFWCGTALSLPSVVTTLHWDSWLLTKTVSACVFVCVVNLGMRKDRVLLKSTETNTVPTHRDVSGLFCHCEVRPPVKTPADWHTLCVRV